jgi:putative salt-induced outer membrane protein YdiY
MNRLIFVVLLAAALPAAAFGDEVSFHNGDRVSGDVTWSADRGELTIRNSVLGTVTARAADVKSVTPAAGPVAGANAVTTRPVGDATATTRAVPDAKTQATTVAASQPAPATAPVDPAVVAAPATPPAPPVKRWSGSVTASLMATRGNSDTESTRVTAEAVRKGESNTLTLSGGYFLGQTRDPQTGDRVTTTDNWFGQGKVDHKLSERFYDYAILRVERDNVANLEVRVSPGVGVGYRWVNDPDFHVNTEAGVNWVYEQYETGGANEHFAVRLAYHVDRQLNEFVSLVHNVEYLPSVSDPAGNFNLNADAGLRAAMTKDKKLFTELKVEWKHDSTPAPGAEKNDLRYTVGVGYSF